MTYGKGCCGCSVLTSCLTKDMREVVSNSFLANCQLLCNLAVALAFCNELQHLRLASGEANGEPTAIRSR